MSKLLAILLVVPLAAQIHIVSATYGANCPRTLPGNVTAFVAAACEGKATCDYLINYQVIGDPAPMCAKIFQVSWQDAAGPRFSSVPLEATGQTLHLIVATSKLPRIKYWPSLTGLTILVDGKPLASSITTINFIHCPGPPECSAPNSKLPPGQVDVLVK